jgi:hypothetical protein
VSNHVALLAYRVECCAGYLSDVCLCPTTVASPTPTFHPNGISGLGFGVTRWQPLHNPTSRLECPCCGVHDRPSCVRGFLLHVDLFTPLHCGCGFTPVFLPADGILLAYSCRVLYARVGRRTCIVVRLFHCLVVVSPGLSLPPRHLNGDLDDRSSVVVLLDGGHSGQVLGEVASGSDDDREDLCVEGLGRRLLDGLLDCEP